MAPYRIVLSDGADLDGFRQALRLLIARGAPPTEVVWSVGDEPLPLADPCADEALPVRLPRAVAELIELIVCHRDPERYALLYTLVWRIRHGERALLEIQSDPLVHRLERMRKSVRRDLHKMHAFLRFRRLEAADAERFVAWFEPDHYILEAVAEFFVERFRGFHWTILTPVGSLHWDRENLTTGPPGKRGDLPAEDAFAAAWRGYYESTFNPARTNPAAMRAEMPKKYWHNTPETRSLPGLIRSASSRVEAMIERVPAVPIRRNPNKAVAAMFDHDPKTLAELNRIIASSPPLVPGATQAVLGEGPEGAALVFVGEQPGDQEDLQGRPFVGPAGQLLNRAMAEAGIARDSVYLTNAVKHFKFEQRGKRRIHQKPTAGEVKHYRWWLVKELELVRPALVVALGATAVLALTGKSLPITRYRGETRFDPYRGYITVHPSYLLRLPDETAKQQGYEAFRNDIYRIRTLLEQRPETPIAAE
jgi:uracil-DNA glycosylase